MCSRGQSKLDGCYSWIVCAAATTLNGVAHSLVLSFGVFLPVLMEEFNQNREKTALIGSLLLAIACFVCPVGGQLCHRYGCQKTLILGSLTCAVSLLITSWSTGINFMYFALCVPYGLGFSFCFMSCYLVVGAYFQKRHSLAMGFVVSGATFAYFIFGPLTQALVDSVGWRNSFRVLSGLFLGSCCLSFLFKSNVENKDVEDHRGHGDRVSATDVQSRNNALDWSVWKNPHFVIPVVAFTIISFSLYSPAIHMVRHFEEMGITRKRSSYLYIGMGLGSLLARIAAGKICEFVSPVHVSRVAILCSGVCALVLSMESSYLVLVFLTLIYGLADGAFQTTFNVIILISVKADQRAFALGFANTAVSVSIAIGPMITGLVADHCSYFEAFLMTGSVTLTGLLVTLGLLCFKNQQTGKVLELKETLIIYEKVTVV